MDDGRTLSRDLTLLLRKTTSVSKLIRTGLFYKRDYKNTGWPSPPPQDVFAETQLNRKILDYALQDYLGNVKELELDVEEWLDLDNPDFVDICEASSVDEEIVFKIFNYFKTSIKH